MAKRFKAPEPWQPVPYDPHIIASIQAMIAGTATPHQQQSGMRWIVEVVCGTYEQPCKFGPDGTLQTYFMGGRIFSGQQIVKMTKLKITSPQEREA